MFERIKMYYNGNKMWVQLGQYILISFLLAVLAILIDTKTIPGLDYIPNLFLTSVDLAKLILSTLSASLLTITTFTFSTIMVVLTMYSSNYSPRVVSNFLTDKITMKVLGIFVGGFFYCILALFFMRKSFSDYLVVSATIAVIYSVLCILYFVVFVYNVSSSIQATRLIDRLYDESYEIIDRALKYREHYPSVDDYDVGYYKFQLELISEKSGYLTLIEFEGILNSLKNLDSKILLKNDVGDFVSKNQAIASLYYNEQIEEEKIIRKLLRNFEVEEERMAYNDYRFSLQKIIDITLRAMSPGINDPNTAIHCINILGVILGRLSEIKGRFTIVSDDESKAELVYEAFNFKEEMYYTFYQIVHYGKEEISIILALFNALKTINQSSSSEKTKTIKEFSLYVYESVIDNFKHEYDVEVLDKAQKAI